MVSRLGNELPAPFLRLHHSQGQSGEGRPAFSGVFSGPARTRGAQTACPSPSAPDLRELPWFVPLPVSPSVPGPASSPAAPSSSRPMILAFGGLGEKSSAADCWATPWWPLTELVSVRVECPQQGLSRELGHLFSRQEEPRHLSYFLPLDLGLCCYPEGTSLQAVGRSAEELQGPGDQRPGGWGRLGSNEQGAGLRCLRAALMSVPY